MRRPRSSSSSSRWLLVGCSKHIDRHDQYAPHIHPPQSLRSRSVHVFLCLLAVFGRLDPATPGRLQSLAETTSSLLRSSLPLHPIPTPHLQTQPQSHELRPGGAGAAAGAQALRVAAPVQRGRRQPLHPGALSCLWSCVWYDGRLPIQPLHIYTMSRHPQPSNQECKGHWAEIRQTLEQGEVVSALLPYPPLLHVCVWTDDAAVLLCVCAHVHTHTPPPPPPPSMHSTRCRRSTWWR